MGAVECGEQRTLQRRQAHSRPPARPPAAPPCAHRVALASCCRALLLSLQDSPAVWGDLQLDVRERAGQQGRRSGRRSLRAPQAHVEHVSRLAAWLQGRAPALRLLGLVLLTGADAERLLPALAPAARLTSLALHSTAVTCQLPQLPHLPAVAELRLTCAGTRGYVSLDAATLAALPGLALLAVETGRGEGLRGLGAGGTALPPALRVLRLRGELPSSLDARLRMATTLQQLSLQHRGSGGSTLALGAGTLAGLAGLTALELWRCGVQGGGLATAVPHLTALASLDLRGSLGPEEDAEGVVAALAAGHVGTSAALTRLSIAQWGVGRLPAALSALPALRELEAGGNRPLCEGLPGAFAPLAVLPALTHLGLARCWLRELPAELAALAGNLRSLNLSGNRLGDYQVLQEDEEDKGVSYKGGGRVQVGAVANIADRVVRPARVEHWPPACMRRHDIRAAAGECQSECSGTIV